MSMRTVSAGLAFGLACLPVPMRAQSPTPAGGLAPLPFRQTWTAPARRYALPALLLAPADTVHIAPTQWLVGGIFGTIIFGALGMGLCGIGDAAPPLTCYLATFTFAGLGLGFPIGALIGGQIPKGP